MPTSEGDGYRTFRRRLARTLHAIAPVLAVDGVMVAGSEVPNILAWNGEILVVSQDVDIAVPVDRHREVKKRLGEVRGLCRSDDEPTVLVPELDDLIEVNFIGMDPAMTSDSVSYILDDEDLPLLVFSTLRYLEPGEPVVVDGVEVPVPRVSGLLVEKLVTDRTGEKGDRDLLVALALLLVSRDDDVDEFVSAYRVERPERKHAIRSALTLLSLIEPRAQMPDPTLHRDRVAALLHRLEREGDA